MPAAFASPDIDLSKPVDFKSLKGKTVVITGGASGFGKAMALLWASKGAFVTIGDIDDKAGLQVFSQLRRISGSRIQNYVHCDVTSWESQKNFFKRACTLSPSGRVDIVIANAGITESGIHTNFKGGPVGADPVKPNLKTMDINTTGLIYTAHLAYWAFAQGPPLPADSPPRTHHLLLVGSMASWVPGPDVPLYNASKHSVMGLFRGLRMQSPFPQIREQKAKEIKERNYRVHVNLLCPYFADTPLVHVLTKEGRPSLASAGMKFVEVDDVVSAATRLVTDESEDGGGKALVISTPEIAKGRGHNGDGTWQLKEIRSRL